jgi:hypothetical protein
VEQKSVELSRLSGGSSASTGRLSASPQALRDPPVAVPVHVMRERAVASSRVWKCIYFYMFNKPTRHLHLHRLHAALHPRASHDPQTEREENTAAGPLRSRATPSAAAQGQVRSDDGPDLRRVPVSCISPYTATVHTPRVPSNYCSSDFRPVRAALCGWGCASSFLLPVPCADAQRRPCMNQDGLLYKLL